MADTILDDYARFAAQLARDAGAVLRDRFGQPHEVRFKGTIDMVTEADQAAEALIAGRLRDAYADHCLLCEEGSQGTALSSRYRWVVDPLDGTTNFAHGLPTFAVSIALEEAGHPIIGVVYDPMRDELFVSHRGGGATLNGEPIHVSLTDRLIASIVVTGFSYDFERRALQADIWRDFLTRVQAIRQTGSAALNLCYIACGRLDGYWERGISPWDVAAGALMVSEGGGTVTDMRGGPFHSDDREILASNGTIHADLLDVIVTHEAPSPGNAQLGA
ncbi:MAG: inositol monophosphatase [Chloroflexi bacterium]|nr:inositol monophosphatase [Chloroflexota bacterium]